jgi:hypothetical protein
MNYTETRQAGVLDKISFHAKEKEITMEVMLKGYPAPSFMTDMSIEDALAVKQALDSTLRYLKAIA